jgi:hypothetical protein
MQKRKKRDLFLELVSPRRSGTELRAASKYLSRTSRTSARAPGLVGVFNLLISLIAALTQQTIV